MEHSKEIAIIEAILFAMGNSVSIEKLSEVIEISKKELKTILKEMQELYSKEDRGIELIWLENSVQLGTKQLAYEYLTKLAKTPPKYVLTDSVLETLSIIAYKQPVTKAEIEKIRGVSPEHAVNKLIEYDLVEEVGRLDAPGKPLMFGTTEQFLRSFGVKSIQDLPEMSPDVYENFRNQAEEEATDELGEKDLKNAYEENSENDFDEEEIIHIDI